MFKSIVIFSFVGFSCFVSFNVIAISYSNNNSLVAKSPSIAKPSAYEQDKKNTSSPQDVTSKDDILVTKPRDVIGGSEHQKISITPYLGVNY